MDIFNSCLMFFVCLPEGTPPFVQWLPVPPQRRTCVCAAICALMDALLRRPLDLRQAGAGAGATRAVQERHGDLFSLHYAGRAGGPESPCRPFILSFLVMQFLCKKREMLRFINSYVACFSFRGWLNDVKWSGCDF